MEVFKLATEGFLILSLGRRVELFVALDEFKQVCVGFLAFVKPRDQRRPVAPLSERVLGPHILTDGQLPGRVVNEGVSSDFLSVLVDIWVCLDVETFELCPEGFLELSELSGEVFFGLQK